MSTLPDSNDSHDRQNRDSDTSGADGEHRPGSLRREHPELTEAAEVSARFAAQMLGGELSSGPPPAGSMLAWLIAHPHRTREDVLAEYARRGVDWEAVWIKGEKTEEDARRLSGRDE